nr:hypothetical protein TQ38_19715 [Novosphingobium sp. P6W]
MMMTPFLRALNERLSRHSHTIVIVDDVSIRMEEGDCPDYIGDELALWCHHTGLRVWRMERSRRDVVRFGFENADAALQYRALCGLLAR